MLTTPDNGVVCAAFLKRQGFSYENLKGYVRSGYLDQLGRGAYCKHGNKPDVAAGVSALNHQLSLPVHVGGKTARTTANRAFRAIYRSADIFVLYVLPQDSGMVHKGF